MRRANLAHLAVDQNLAAIGGVETVSDAHRRRFSRAVFTDDRMNRSRRDFEAHPVIRQNGAEAFRDVSQLDHGLWSLAFGLSCLSGKPLTLAKQISRLSANTR